MTLDKSGSAAVSDVADQHWSEVASSSWQNTQIKKKFDDFLSVVPMIDFNRDGLISTSELREGIDNNYIPDAQKPIAEFLIKNMPELHAQLDPGGYDSSNSIRIYDVERLRGLLDEQPHYPLGMLSKDFIFTTEGGLVGSLVGMTVGGLLCWATKGNNLSMNLKIGMAAGAFVGGIVGHHNGADYAETKIQFKSLQEQGLHNTLEQLKRL